MYQNCCKKCGSIDLYTNKKGNNIGLYCSDCGSWNKWLSKDELRAFEYSKKQKILSIDINNMTAKEYLSSIPRDEIEKIIYNNCCPSHIGVITGYTEYENNCNDMGCGDCESCWNSMIVSLNKQKSE